jgi:hypothetical protein
MSTRATASLSTKTLAAEDEALCGARPMSHFHRSAMSIIGMHAIMYSRQAEAVREFLRETLGWSSVDAGRGWLIFAAPPTEMAVHPTDGAPHHELFLMCTDLEATLADLTARGVGAGPIAAQPWGRVTTIQLPGGEQLGLYEPRHPLAIPHP